jgi:opacity protein-like surface antigen
MKLFTPSAIAAVLLAMAAAPAAAQAQEERITLTFAPAFATVGGDTATALSGSVGYRFTEHVSFEGDFTWIDAAAGGFRNQFGFDTRDITTGVVTDLLQRGNGNGVGRGNDARLPALGIGNLTPAIIRTIAAPTFLASADGQTMIGTLGLRYEPTVQTARFRPYVSGGLGLNRTEQDFNLAAATASSTFDDSISNSGFAFSAGGGANIRLFSSLWANADAKYFRLSGDRNIMRLGGGVTFKF